MTFRVTLNRALTSCDVARRARFLIRELKQQRFRATHVNRKWPFFIFWRWFRANFQSNRLYNSKEAKEYKFYISRHVKRENTSLPVDVRRSKTSLLKLPIRERKQRRRRRQREGQKTNRFILAKQQLCTCITLFSTFLYRRCTTTSWNFLISRFVEDVNTTPTIFFSFCPTLIQSFRIQLQKNIPAFNKLNELE